MTHYQQQVLNSTPYYSHWITKLKFNLNLNHNNNHSHLNTTIKNDTLIYTNTTIDNTSIFHTKPIHVFFIVLRVDNDDYIILTTNKDSDIGSGYRNFLQLPTGDIDMLDNLPIQMIHLSITKQEAIPLKVPQHFFLSNYKYIIKCIPHKWNWFNQNENDFSTKKNDYEKNLVGWWTNPNQNSQYCQFYQIIKNISLPNFFKIVQEIEDRNDKNDTKLVIVHKQHLLSYSPDLRTTTALLLTNESNRHPNYFIDRIDIYYSIIISFFLTLLIIFIHSTNLEKNLNVLF
jgi:hypothetical protein